jgi:excisionase family DNA binding protein
MPADPLELLTIPEVAARLHLSRGTVNRYVQSGVLPSVCVGRSRRVSRGQLSSFFETLEQRGSIPTAWPRARTRRSVPSRKANSSDVVSEARDA